MYTTCRGQYKAMQPATLPTYSNENEAGHEGIQHQKKDSQLEILYQKGVKHLCDRGIKRVPNKYILPISDQPVNINGEVYPKKKSFKLPIIDFAELQGPRRSEMLKALANACEQYGFFQLINHGVPLDVTSSMIDVCKRFFELPFEERFKYMSSDISSPVRYGTSFNQKNDGVFCWRDFLKLICNPFPQVLTHWPSSPADLRKVAEAYSKETKYLFVMLMKAILLSLELQVTTENDTKEDDMTKDFQDGSQMLVTNCYPPCPEPDLTLGIPPHSDYGFLTLLLQDEVNGLQIQYQGEWVMVEPMPNAFIINVGDHLEIFSNGKYKSVLHRVLTNSKRIRITVASLHSLPFKCKIQPWPRLINEQNPRCYKETDFSAFLSYISSCEAKKKNFLESRKLT